MNFISFEPSPQQPNLNQKKVYCATKTVLGASLIVSFLVQIIHKTFQKVILITALHGLNKYQTVWWANTIIMHEFTIEADNFSTIIFVRIYCAVREDYRTGHHKLRFLAIILLQNHAFSLKTLAVVSRKPYLQNFPKR